MKIKTLSGIKKLYPILALLIVLVISVCMNHAPSKGSIVPVSTGLNTISDNMETFGFVTGNDECIVFSAPSQLSGRFCVYKKDIQSDTTEKISDTRCRNLHYFDGWIYYINMDDGKLYKMDLDGNNSQLLYDLSVAHLVADGGDFYVMGYDDVNSERLLYRLNSNGTDKQLLWDQAVSGFKVYGGYIYAYGVDGKNYKIDCTRENEPSVLTLPYAVSWFNFSNDTCYYLVGSMIGKLDADGNKKQIALLGGDPIPSTIVIAENELHCVCIRLAFFSIEAVYTITNLETGKVKMIPLRTARGLGSFYNNIFNGKVYLFQKGVPYQMNMDGTRLREIILPA